MNASSNELSRLVKVVYFDEDAASDYIDLAAGGVGKSLYCLMKIQAICL